VTEAEWLASTDTTPMLEFLKRRGSDRKLRLFACACCRLVWDRLTDPCSRRAVEVAERYADGEARGSERAAAWNAAVVASRTAARAAAAYAARRVPWSAAQSAAGYVVASFRPLPQVSPAWLAWEDGTGCRRSDVQGQRGPYSGDSLTME
jgi:hypothetical protein